MKVLLPRPPGDDFIRTLRERIDPGIELLLGSASSDARDYDWLVEGVPTEEQITRSSRLRGVVVPWAGVSTRTLELVRLHPHLTVHNLHHNAPATAELAFALLSAVARRIVPIDQALRRGDWAGRDDSERNFLLAGRSAVILGLGAIGRRVAKFCLAFGMPVTAVCRTSRTHSAWGSDLEGVEVRDISSLQDLLPQARVLFLTLPLTEETRGLIGERELGLLPRDAILVNVARGPIVDEDALFAALESHRIAGAGLDVWYRYPRDEDDRRDFLPSSRPFHTLENVVLSPHRGGDTLETETLRATALAELLAFAVRGEEMPNRVDTSVGY
ncbi:MAG: 2-hydroxyacid dehydrogenase [Candidatus Eisenbacteria bacterium]